MPPQRLGSADYYTLCRYKRAPNLTKLTRLEQRKAAYDQVKDDPSSDEDDPDSGDDPQVCAGWRLSDVDTLPGGTVPRTPEPRTLAKAPHPNPRPNPSPNPNPSQVPRTRHAADLPVRDLTSL